MTKQSPPGWGNDSLTKYLDNYRDNQFATFVGKRAEVSDLILIDGMYKLLLDGAKNPKPFIPMTFFLRAHSAFRSATGAVMAGQLYEAQTLLRLCLEHSSYALYIGPDTERWKRWMSRHDSEDARKAVRSEFTAAKILKCITSMDTKLAASYETLYERLIDFGAHPNEHGFSMSSTIRRVDGDLHLDTVYLHGDGVPLDHALRTTVQVGIWGLNAAEQLYGERMKLLSIAANLVKLRKRY